MRRIIAAVVLAAGVASCNPVTAVMDGMKHKNAAEDSLQETTGVKPQVGFNWNNGKLVSVTVQFPRVYDAKPLGELAGTVQAVVVKEFKATPETIVLAFALGK